LGDRQRLEMRTGKGPRWGQANNNEKFDIDKNDWIEFVNSTYGCLSDDPIERGEQGKFENREVID